MTCCNDPAFHKVFIDLSRYHKSKCLNELERKGVEFSCALCRAWCDIMQ